MIVEIHKDVHFVTNILIHLKNPKHIFKIVRDLKNPKYFSIILHTFVSNILIHLKNPKHIFEIVRDLKNPKYFSIILHTFVFAEVGKLNQALRESGWEETSPRLNPRGWCTFVLGGGVRSGVTLGIMGRIYRLSPKNY